MYNDPAIGVDWPIAQDMEILLSDRDTKWSGIENYKKEHGIQ